MTHTINRAVPWFWADGEKALDGSDATIAASLASMFAQIDLIGHAPGEHPQHEVHDDSGYNRFAWSQEDLALRQWFAAQAEKRGLRLSLDNAGNQWAWWEPIGSTYPAITTGSHLDSVPGGGPFDGPLGVLSALAAIDILRDQGWLPHHPVGIVNFSDEEGAALGLACFGSRVLTGVINPQEALVKEGYDGETLRTKLLAAGINIERYGPDKEALQRIYRHVELHIEQGYFLDTTEFPVAVASHIWPHGRWRITITGKSNHAGTTPLARRNDPMLTLASLIQQARASAEHHGGLATIGKITVEPNGVNVIPSSVTAWLDCRAEDEATVRRILADLAHYEPVQESWTSATAFDPAVAADIRSALGFPEVPVIGTGAGHDAGILQQAGIPTGMLFVRNHTGDSHTPTEFAHLDDAVQGTRALAATIRHLTERDRSK
jgi:N-carbamoyl-L-amino-acid hydrolase